jgi:hypothetical protein
MIIQIKFHPLDDIAALNSADTVGWCDVIELISHTAFFYKHDVIPESAHFNEDGFNSET